MLVAAWFAGPNENPEGAEAEVAMENDGACGSDDVTAAGAGAARVGAEAAEGSATAGGEPKQQ